MFLQAGSVFVCLFLTQVAANTGFHLFMERHPDKYFCARLYCVADLTHSDHDVFSLVEMAIYDITRVNTDLKLASVSRFRPDLYVDTTKSSTTSCTGTITRHQANLTVQLRHDIDCQHGVYKCQLDMVTSSGHSDVLTEILTPELNHNYSRMAEMIRHIPGLTELLNNPTSHLNNQTDQINRLASQLDDHMVEIMHQKTQLNNISLTRQLVKSEEIDDVTQNKLKELEEKLDNLTTEIFQAGSYNCEIVALNADGSNSTVRSRIQVGNTCETVAKLTRLVSRANDELGALKRKVSNLTQSQVVEIEALKNKVSSLTQSQVVEIEALKNKVSSLTHSQVVETEALKNKVTNLKHSHVVEIEALKNKVSNLTQSQAVEIEALKNKVSNLTQSQAVEILALKKKVSNLTQSQAVEILALKKKVSNLTQSQAVEIEALKKTVSNLKPPHSEEGYVECGSSTTWGQYMKPRETVKEVRFQVPYERVPQVVIVPVILDEHSHTRMSLLIRDLTVNGFKIVCGTWWDSHINGMNVRWTSSVA